MTTQEATAPASANGAAPDLSLPVESFREAAPLLRRPFTVDAVKFKVQASWPSGALIVGYIDARLVVERLNLVCPHLWFDRYESPGGGLMWCHLTVDGITRSDVGEGKGKGLVSDALKRAGVKFGIGVSLYALPKITLNDSDGHLKRKQRQGKEDIVETTPNGDTRVRTIYSMWLDAHGRQAFGEPLDHGDAPEAVGDAEAEVPAADPQTGEVLAGSAEVTALKAAAKGLTFPKIKMAFAAIGLPAPEGQARAAFDAVPQSRVLDLGKALEGIER